MKQILTYLSIIFVLVSCVAGNTTTAMEDAQYAIETKDYNYAKKICDDLMIASGKDEPADRAAILCELSMLYMRLAEASDYDANVECAVKCYTGAYDVDSTVAAAYYDSIAVDDMTHWALMSSIVSARKQPQQILDTDEEEMIYVNEADSTIDVANHLHNE